MEGIHLHAKYLLHGNLMASSGLELTVSGIRDDDLQVSQEKP
jgi:hypothetical protein